MQIWKSVESVSSFADRTVDAAAVISNCYDRHHVSRLTYLKDMMEAVPELNISFYGDCSPNGRFAGSKQVWSGVSFSKYLKSEPV